jgi:hypothetical protein
MSHFAPIVIRFPHTDFGIRTAAFIKTMFRFTSSFILMENSVGMGENASASSYSENSFQPRKGRISNFRNKIFALQAVQLAV